MSASKQEREITLNFFRHVMEAMAADMGRVVAWSGVNAAEIEAIGKAVQELDEAVTAATDRMHLDTTPPMV